MFYLILLMYCNHNGMSCTKKKSRGNTVPDDMWRTRICTIAWTRTQFARSSILPHSYSTGWTVPGTKILFTAPEKRSFPMTRAWCSVNERVCTLVRRSDNRQYMITLLRKVTNMSQQMEDHPEGSVLLFRTIRSEPHLELI